MITFLLSLLLYQNVYFSAQTYFLKFEYSVLMTAYCVLSNKWFWYNSNKDNYDISHNKANDRFMIYLKKLVLERRSENDLKE